MNGEGKDSSSSVVDAKQEALKKAGAEYFEKVLSQARQGKNPLNEDPRSRPRQKDIESQDEDLQTVGQALPYLIGALFYSSSTAQLVMAKRALEALQTPAIQMFLHLLPAVCLMYFLIELGPLTAKSMRGSATSIIFFGIQTLAVFGGLKYSSLPFVLSWTTFLPPLLTSVFTQVSPRPGGLQMAFLLLGAVGGGVAALFQNWPSLTGSVCALAWATVEVARMYWERLKVGPHTSVVHIGERYRELIVALAEAEKEVEPSVKTFLSAAISAVPALIIGFIFQEGRHLVEHELSVPDVSNMLISCAAWATASVTAVTYFRRTQAGARKRLTAFTALASLVLYIMLEGLQDWQQVLAASFAVAGGVGAQQLTNRSQ